MSSSPTLVRTTCTRDCPDACGLVATVDGDRVVRLQGDPEHPITRGFLCYRVGTHYLSRQHSPERLTTPRLRKDGRSTPVSWDEAFDVLASTLDRIRRESGAAAILHLQGGGSLGMLKNLNGVFSRLLGATETRGDVCDAAGAWACEQDFGAVDASALHDLENARGVVLWGKNVAASSPHTATFVKDARRAGAEVVLVDPLPHRTLALADRFVQPRPGGDAALALGAARAILDAGRAAPDLDAYTEHRAEYEALVRTRDVAGWAAEADVPVEEVRALARFFVERAPVTTLLGWGMQRRRNGATQVRAVNALHALTGNLGRPGAGASFSTSRRAPFDLAVKDALADRVPRTLRVATLGHDVLAADDPPIRAVLIDNMNPVATNPDAGTTRRALESRDFVCVIDQFDTDTTATADLVLPTTTMLEEDDLVGAYGHHHVSAARAVVPPPDGPRTDLAIYQELARRLDLGDALEGTPREWMTRLGGRLRDGGVTLDDLARGAPRAPRAPLVAWEGRRFATPSGRFRFLTDLPATPPDDPDYPLRFQALSTGRWQASQLTRADEEREGALVCTVHPDAAPGIEDGGEAWLESRVGRLRVVVRHDDRYRKDTVYVPRARSVADGRCVNAIISARLTDHGEGAAYYDEGVRLRAV